MPTKKLKTVGRTTNPCKLAVARTISAHRDCARGLVFYLCVLAAVSVFLAVNFDANQRVYEAGEIAETDVLADRSIQVVDQAATDARRRRVMSAQPPVYDYSLDTYIAFESRLIALMNEANGAPVKRGAAPAAKQFSAEIGADLAKDVLPQFGLASTQNFILKQVLPLLRSKLAEGMVGDVRAARVPSGVAIRNLESGTESLLQDVQVLPDTQSLLTEISNMARADRTLSHDARRAINILLVASMPPTLTLNREATQRRAAEYASHLEPVTYQIQRGEVIARRGDRITAEQQIKIQNLYSRAVVPFNWQQALGTFLVSLFISVGFFLSPSGKPGSVIHPKDLSLMAVVTLLTALSARGVHALSAFAASPALGDAFSLAFPLAGAVGFVATVFSARRYVTLGLLLTLVTSLAMDLSFHFAFFHFLSSMLATWLVSNSVSRQDAVWNLLPIILGEVLLICGLSLISGTPFSMLPMLITAVCINAVLMLILFFSFSPVLETLFGYSTRFKLMEYINLEQPLMQEIMVAIPGTYHHSLVVANMVEAGAKAIGANSLLCKVAALYHDCGKLVYPQYFVENQFGAPNKHDKLSPSMSALIIISHVKKGVEICSRYRLGQEITDIVAQHHGDRIMRYFYQKAVNLGQNPNEEDFRYPGPKPQSKEAAILMLADSVEASSRTLTDPTPARLKAHIEKIIKGILDEGQLSEADITFRDMHLLAEAFQRVLTGIFHHRVVYPEAKKDPRVQAVNDLMPTTHPLASAARAIPPLPQPVPRARDSEAARAEAGAPADAGEARKVLDEAGRVEKDILAAEAANAPADEGEARRVLDEAERVEKDILAAPAAEAAAKEPAAAAKTAGSALLLTQPAPTPYPASEEEMRAASEKMADRVFCGPLSRDHPSRLCGQGAADLTSPTGTASPQTGGAAAAAPADPTDLTGLMPAAEEASEEPEESAANPAAGRRPGFWQRLRGRKNA
ncbi:MAG: HDIG domain-containing protein [Desulfovibrionaceae bacterium]|nr:HDIG domain-containing protein [Desulfovibrionaceae bacterium]